LEVRGWDGSVFRPEEIIAKLREADVLLDQGKKASEVIRAWGSAR